MKVILESSEFPLLFSIMTEFGIAIMYSSKYINKKKNCVGRLAIPQLELSMKPQHQKSVKINYSTFNREELTTKKQWQP